MQYQEHILMKMINETFPHLSIGYITSGCINDICSINEEKLHLM